MKSIFIGPRGLRAGWSFLLFVAGWLAISTPAMLLIQKVYTPHEGMHPVDYLVSDGLGFLSALAAAGILAKVERRKLGDFGLRVSRGFLLRFAEGCLWGAVPLAILALAVWKLGGVDFNGLAFHGTPLLFWASLWGATMIVLGFFEEFLFRGYPLFRLAEGMNFWPAALLLSAIFGGLHYFTKPMETWADALSVSLIGLFVCLTIARTGDLWLAAGFHAAFDYVALSLLGAPNTGNDGKPVTGHLLATKFHGPAWLTGGPCGLEASLLIFPVIAAMFIAFHFRFPGSKRSSIDSPGPC